MKKISFVLLMMTFVLISAAQTGVNFGIKGGLNIANLDINKQEQNSRLGLNAGFIVQVPVSPDIAIQPEVLYSSQGAKYQAGGAEHNLQLDYLNIPVQFQLMVGRGFRAQTGPQVGILTKVEDEMNGAETGFFTKDDFKKTDIGWVFGFGYKTAGGFGIDARYNLGLTNVNKTGSNTIRNNVVQVGLFYMFR
ncbi:MAG TPA: porin family protein [Flavisolibacter sp.]